VNRNFNISQWALAHRSFVWFLVIIIVAAGGLSYLRLGRNEDPTFTIKTMVVQVIWPGANITDTLQQITDRVEKKLQETPGLDYIRSYTVAGTSTVFVTLKGSVEPRRTRRLVSSPQEDRRHPTKPSARHCRSVLQR
jgi:multidrug efflux pump